MLKPRFLVLSLIVSMTLWGCFIEFDDNGPSLKIVNQYHQPINRIAIFETTTIYRTM
jgi:hypothetical protein